MVSPRNSTDYPCFIIEMKISIKKLLLLPALLVGLGLILPSRAVAQTYPNIAGYYTETATAVVTLTASDGENATQTYMGSGSGNIFQTGNTFSSTVIDPYSGMPLTQSGVLSGNNIISMSGPAFGFSSTPGLVVTYNQITSGSGIVEWNQILIHETGRANFTYMGVSVQLVTTNTIILSGNVTPLPTGHIYCTCDRSPIAGATVSVGGYLATSDSNGGFAINGITPGTYLATISQANYYPTNFSITVPSGSSTVTNNFNLTPSGYDIATLNAIVIQTSIVPQTEKNVGTPASPIWQVVTDGTGTKLYALFTPGLGLSISNAACRLGYDHFNWVQLASGNSYRGVLYDCLLTYQPIYFIDPPPPNQMCDGQPYQLSTSPTIQYADSPPFYYNEGSAFPGTWNITNQVIANGQQLRFGDQPSLTIVGDIASFVTSLVGVRSDGTFKYFRHFKWASTFNGTLNNVRILAAGDFGLTNGTGSITNLQTNVQPVNIPTSALALMSQIGGQFAVTIQPPVQTVARGANVTFAIYPTNSFSSPLNYQWRINGTNISGATNLTLQLLAVTTNSTGNYDAVLSNSNGSIASAVANLTVITVNFKTLHSFTAGSDGANPQGGLILLSNTLYGSTYYGGPYGYYKGDGTIFAVNTNGTSYTNLYSFTDDKDGANPNGLILSGKTLYGTTYDWGGMTYGTVFKMSTDGTSFTNLYYLNGGSDGGYPEAGLILSGSTLYGTAVNDGNGHWGTVFKVDTDGNGFTNLHSFTGGSDGGSPVAALIISSNTLYGTTEDGGSFGNGTIFAVNTNGMGFTNLYSFTGGSDGSSPQAGLVLAGNTLFGTAYYGGISGAGTVFAVNTNGTGFTNLYSFTGGIDGGYPMAGLILSGNTLYGTTYHGGSSGNGTVFKINTDGSDFTTLYSFTALSSIYYNYNFYNVNSDGANPEGGLILSGNTLYGTAYDGGTNGYGTVFSLSSSSFGSVVAPLVVTTTSLPNGTNGTTYSQTLTASGGQTPYSWTNSLGALPSGLHLSTNGVISGTPTNSGTFNFTVKVTDALSETATQPLTLTVGNPVILSAPQITLGKTNFTFLLSGPAGSNYVLQVSTNLLNWNPVSTSTIPVSGTINLSNAISGYNRRFYRVLMQ